MAGTGAVLPVAKSGASIRINVNVGTSGDCGLSVSLFVRISNVSRSRTRALVRSTRRIYPCSGTAHNGISMHLRIAITWGTIVVVGGGGGWLWLWLWALWLLSWSAKSDGFLCLGVFLLFLCLRMCLVVIRSVRRALVDCLSCPCCGGWTVVFWLSRAWGLSWFEYYGVVGVGGELERVLVNCVNLFPALLVILDMLGPVAGSLDFPIIMLVRAVVLMPLARVTSFPLTN